MNAILASLIAMSAGWGCFIAGTVVVQIATRGKTTDIFPMAVQFGLIILVSWGLIGLPLVLLLKPKALLYDRRISWFSWAVIAVGIYAAFSLPLYGVESLIIAWAPATMGTVTGFTFARLVRSENAGIADVGPGAVGE